MARRSSKPSWVLRWNDKMCNTSQASVCVIHYREANHTAYKSFRQTAESLQNGYSIKIIFETVKHG